MKPSFESVHAAGNNSFLIRKFREKKFSAPYHFHPEYELTLITTGSGKRYVGFSMNDFHAGDFVLLGSNLPHCWKSDEATATIPSSSVVIQFREDFLGKDFLERPEIKRIHKLLERSSQGIQFTGDNTVFRKLVRSMLSEKSPFKKLAIFLDLLHELSITRHVVLLNPPNRLPSSSEAGQKRMHTVTAYIVANFESGISLEGAAATVHLTTPAFCRFFKKMTRKTFMEAVTDYRIDYAQKQLVNTEKTIAAIGFNSGFNDISNFHKTFRHRTGFSPLVYRKRFLQEK